jgi:hypothetical protein
MNDQIETIRKTRSFLLDYIKELNIGQLNKIPAGFNNNIAWNLGHMVAAQQGVCYLRAGLKTWVNEDFFNAYKPGSKPTEYINEQQIEKIKELFFSSLDILKSDYVKGLWTNYSAWSTRYGVELKTIEDAIQFLNFHEGLHLGYVMALKRAI